MIAFASSNRSLEFQIPGSSKLSDLTNFPLKCQGTLIFVLIFPVVVNVGIGQLHPMTKLFGDIV